MPRRRHGGVVVLLSGGIESTALLALAGRTYEWVSALTIGYGQRTWDEERRAAEAVARALRITEHRITEHRVVDCSGLGPLLTGCALTDARVALPTPPHGETDASARRTFVPNRNAILLAIAYADAQARGAAAVGIGVTEAVYPDCNPPFLRAFARMQRVAQAGMLHGGRLPPAGFRGIRLWAPFAGRFKHETVAEGLRLGAPFALTRSCLASSAPERGSGSVCGRCASCQGRAAAFAACGVPDPALTLGEMPDEMPDEIQSEASNGAA